ncbi:MAG: hypothetical protein WCR61_06535 [Bacteroidales bacterium]|nr:hypothetical protein [Bacteroidales bacterium]MDD4656998.1 hypothetical protein [Bacteroidales bacterium]
MNKTAILISLFCIIINNKMQAQHLFEFDGQASIYGSYSPKNDLNLFIGGRYLPELNYGYTFKNKSMLDFEASANIYGSVLFSAFDSSNTDGNIKPYRVWARYTGNQFEVRLGLQKINFGTASILRPLQWFDQMDPRDPLQFTTGVYGALGRYYFLNNANIWAWVLYGNESARGFEPMSSKKNSLEFGGRIQLPVPKGEIGFTYHHRNASSKELATLPAYDNIPENRYGLDGKWDVEVGVWFEAVHINKAKDVGILTNQSFLTVGVDYTFALGSGLNVSLENMLISYNKNSFDFKENSNITATSIMYPLGFFDNISTIFNYSWKSKELSFFLNYQHQFKKLTGYIMAYYNPDTQPAMGAVSYENSFSGAGFRLMLVFNH